MATITEDYVSFETAKLLKEKGFDVPCNCYGTYNAVNLTYRLCITDKYTNWNKHANELIISCPTLQMAMKWLRKVHNIHIVIKSVIRTYGDTEYYYELYGTKNKSLCVVCDIYKGESWDSSEKACEAAIKYCLEKLIRITMAKEDKKEIEELKEYFPLEVLNNEEIEHCQKLSKNGYTSVVKYLKNVHPEIGLKEAKIYYDLYFNN